MASRASTAITINNSVTLPATVTQINVPTKTDLSGTTPSTWASLVIELMLVNGSVPPTKGIPVIVKYGFSGQSLTAANINAAPVTLTLSSVGSFETLTNGVASSTIVVNSGAIPILGDFLYTWIVVPDNLVQTVAATLTATQATAVTSQIFSA